MTDVPVKPTKAIPHIGAFVLETLTLGMYGEPRHTLREYIQNAFDSIRAAQRLRVLQGRGVVVVSLGDDSIAIRDNGTGVSAAQAYRTLTSVGASKKDRQRDAGFRGIGRLAGMAYCDTLVFTTTFHGEQTLTVVTFDCKMLLQAMAPDSGGDVELSTLLESAITFTQASQGADDNEHYFEVKMIGVAGAPASLKDFDEVCAYLAETVPVPFDPGWHRGGEIEQGYRDFFGKALETIDLYVSQDENKTQIFKPYGDAYEHAKGETELTEITFEQDPKGRYWGWIGHFKESVAVTDWQTRGLRMRVRNIQVDGTQLFEDLFTQVKPSYGRFTTLFVGEVHLDPESVIPNARRDGFEETLTWLQIKKDLSKNICEPLAKEAYATSESAQADIGKVITQVEDLKSQGSRLTNSSKASFEQVVDLLTTARRLRRKTTSALKVAGSIAETISAETDTQAVSQVMTLQEANHDIESIESKARMLIGRFMDDDEKTVALRARIREELTVQMLEIVNAYVDPATYQAIRRRLIALQ